MNAGAARSRAGGAEVGRRDPRRALAAFLALVALGWSDPIAPDRALSPRDAVPLYPAGRSPKRPPLRGDDFPDGVLALTWDDGPDTGTVELARYLHDAKVSGTFFVVAEWVDGVSMEPGTGRDVYRTGYEHLRVLSELTRLGHRLGSHTRNHVVLTDAPRATVTEQLVRGHGDIDPLLTNELRMFRAPGGAWDREAASATADPFLHDVIGPVHWDVDGKDWEGSLFCHGVDRSQCEPGPVPGSLRVRADVMARRYVARAQEARRGIVLLHDRVGDVGSRYALDLARVLVPELQARGFVLAAPVLAFSAMRERSVARPGKLGDAVFADIDGDGLADLCHEDAGSIVCARAAFRREGLTATRHVGFGPPLPIARVPSGGRGIAMADLDADGRADLCVLVDGEVDCALRRDGALAAFERWARLPPVGDVAPRALRLADVDGDGRADACVETVEGVVCMSSTGRSFASPRLWLERRSLDAAPSAFAASRAPSVEPPGAPPRLALADLDGDRRADLCRASAHGIDCALSDGRRFSSPSRWSRAGDFEDDPGMRLADLNGDGRADACAAGARGVECALSNGRAFTRASLWSPSRAIDIRLADVSGDGRADLCVVEAERLTCAMAP